MLVPPAGERLAREKPREQVAVAVAGVDDHPARHVPYTGGFPLVDLVGRLDVGQRLVHVALAGLVDDDRPGQVALGQTEPRTARQRDGRAPPRVVHQCDLGAGGDARADAAAGVELRAGRPVHRRRLGLVLLAHLQVALEAAGADDDTAARPHDVLGAVALHLHADDAALGEDQLAELGLVHHRHARVHQRLAQADGDRVAHAEQALAAQAGEGAPQQHPEHRDRAAEGAQAQADLPEVALQHHHVGRGLGVLRVQSVELLADDAPVDRVGLDRAAAGAAAGLLRLVVGVLRHPAEAHGGAVADEVHDLGATLEVGVAPHLRHNVTDDRVEIGLGRLDAVGLAGRAQCVVVGDPDPAAAAGRRAAEVLTLLQQHRLQAVGRGAQRRTHAGRTGSHDDDIHLCRQRAGRTTRHGAKL